MIKAIITVHITVDENTEIVITKNIKSEFMKINLRETADDILTDLVGKIPKIPASAISGTP